MSLEMFMNDQQELAVAESRKLFPELYQSLQDKIDEGMEDIKNSLIERGIDMEQSIKAREEYMDVIRKSMMKEIDITKIEKSEMERMMFDSYAAGVKEEVDCWADTMTKPLMKVDTNFVCIPSNETLISPSGFHPTDHVFIQTTIAIHSDKTMRFEDLPNIGRAWHQINVSNIKES